MITNGNMVMARFTNTGTHEGEYQGIKPTGKKWESGGVWIARMRKGKLSKLEKKQTFLDGCNNLVWNYE